MHSTTKNDLQTLPISTAKDADLKPLTIGQRAAHFGFSLVIVVSLLLVSVLITSCSMERKMNQTNDNTKSLLTVSRQMDSRLEGMYAETKTLGANTNTLAQVTPGMANNLETLATKTPADIQSIRDNTSQLLGDLHDALPAARAAMSESAAGAALERLVAAKTFEMKIIEAGTYYQALEFQHWTGRGPDNETSRNELQTSALRRTLAIIGELIGTTPVLNLVSQMSPYKRELDESSKTLMNVSAMVFAMHTLSQHQVDLAKTNRFVGKSFLDIVEGGLMAISSEAKGNIPANGNLPQNRVVMNNLPQVRALLQIRHNILSLRMITMVSGLNDNLGLFEDMAKQKWPVAYSRLIYSGQAEAALMVAGLLQKSFFHLKLAQASRPNPTVPGSDIKMSSLFRNMDTQSPDLARVSGPLKPIVNQIKDQLVMIRQQYRTVNR
jgi:hypothetical protein